MDVKGDYKRLSVQEETSKNSTDKSSTQQHSDQPSQCNEKRCRYSKEDRKQNGIEPLLPEGY